MTQKIDWVAPPLSSDDERLVSIYHEVGRSLDDLPYTKDFDRLFRQIGLTDTPDNRHSIWKRLLRLRKTGRLPRVPNQLATSVWRATQGGVM